MNLPEIPVEEISEEIERHLKETNFQVNHFYKALIYFRKGKIYKKRHVMVLLKQVFNINVSFQISMKAITILRYMSDNVDILPLGVTTRMVITHDVPVLFVQLIEEKPWIKKHGANVRVFEGSDWIVSLAS